MSQQHARGATTRRDVVRVWGPDAESFLQGQLSQDVGALAVGTSSWTFVLQPQGKVDAWARLTRTAADELLLDTDAGWGQALHDRLRRFLIRTKAELELTEQPAVAVRGPGAPHGDLPDGVVRLPAAGPGVEGYDLLGAGAELPAGVGAMSAGELRAHDVAHGVPAMGRELTESTIPAEVGSWIVDESVSFTKGCYVGQELTARIDSRGGNVPRHLRALVLDAPVEEGAGVDCDGPPATITTAATSEVHGPIALAFLGRAVAPGAAVTVAGVHGVVHELPLT
ncbi:MAG: YgfZ/GcvT domain-containing protein [Acidimicrobiia bacterium]